MTKIFSILLYVTFIGLLLTVAGLFLASLLPIPGNIEIKIVKSGSMEPTILTGSVVIVKPQASYAEGDIITFGEDSKLQIPTTHRIIDIQGDFTNLTYTTKGDANEEEDPAPVHDGDIIGKVVVWVPYLGYVLDFARQPIGFTLMIGIPAGIIILDEIIRIIKEVRGMRTVVPAKKRDEDEDQGHGNSPMSYQDFVERATSSARTVTRNIDGIRPRMI
jgi:signal peptidase